MEIEQPINDKVKEYCHYCVCKSCEDVQRLQAENAKLNAIIDGYQPKLQALKDENYGLNQELLGYKKGVQAAEIIEIKAENERLKEENFNFEEIIKLCRCEQYQQTLQEIKAIAEKELSYDMSDNEYRHYRNYDIIRHLITKTEDNQ